MKHRLRGADILRAFRVTLPVMAGYVVLGIGFGIGIAYVASILIGYEFVFNTAAVFLATVFSAVVGIVFGMLPARRAAKMNPIEALRSV